MSVINHLRVQSRRQTALSLLCIALVGAANAGDPVELKNGTVTGGGGIGTSGCYALIGTIGEAVTGTVDTGQYKLTSGFAATVGAPGAGGGIPVGDSIFGNGFEGNGGCEP